MRISLVAVLLSLLTLGIATTRADDKAVEQEMKALQGKWSIVSAEAEGKPYPGAKKDEVMEFKGNKMIAFGREATISIDPTKSPKHLNLTMKIEDRTLNGPAIYRIDNDELSILHSSNAFLRSQFQSEATRRIRYKGYGSSVDSVETSELIQIACGFASAQSHKRHSSLLEHFVGAVAAR